MANWSGARWALLLVLGLPAVVSAQTVTSRDPTGREIRRKCEFTMSRKSVPPVGSVIDSAGTLEALAALLAESGFSAVVSLVYLPGVEWPEVRWSELAAGPDLVLSAVRAHAIVRPVNDPWAIRLRISGGASPDMQAEPAVYCPPQPYGAEGTRIVPFRIEANSADRIPSRSDRLVVEALVLADGRVADIRLVRSSGMRQLDDEVINALRTVTFLPAVLDGVPVPGTHRTETRIR